MKSLFFAVLCVMCVGWANADARDPGDEREPVQLRDRARVGDGVLLWPDEISSLRGETHSISQAENMLKKGLASGDSTAPASNGLFLLTKSRNPGTRRDLPLARTVSPGRADAIPEVLSGRVVHMSLRTGGVTLERVGLALANGRLGQTVRVRLPGVSTPVAGKVTGMGRLDVQL